jgi:hypothetical protein
MKNKTMNQSLSHQSMLSAFKLASEGEEFSHLMKFLEPNEFLRLKIQLTSLPESILKQTIFGKTVLKSMPKKDEKKRKV